LICFSNISSNTQVENESDYRKGARGFSKERRMVRDGKEQLKENLASYPKISYVTLVIKSYLFIRCMEGYREEVCGICYCFSLKELFNV
jgi:hypothetical protein